MRLPFILVAVSALSACAPAAQVSMSRPETGVGVEPASAPLPARPAASVGSAYLRQSFMDLTFALESGRQLDIFSRFEGPITVALAGTVPPSAVSDLGKVLARLRTEAGLDIRQTPGPARITIEFASRAELRRLAPMAACFVVPNVSSLDDYRQKRGTRAVDWTLVTRRETAAIFIPDDTSPQEVRDCLHEELAQALGPLNDLYRLPNSVFNDDNFHSILTPFDMEVLRLTYAPQLQSGMTRAQVADRIGAPPQTSAASPSDWTRAIEAALARAGSFTVRQSAAERALALALAAGWQDSRTAFSHFALGRLIAASDPERALESFKAASAIYTRLPGGKVQMAHVDLQLAAMALANGDYEDAVALADRAIPVVRAAENYALLATLMLIKAEALEQLGDLTAAATLRLDSQPYASYGIGADGVVQARIRDISSVADRATSG